MPASHHPPHNDTILKLTPEEYASSSESGRAKKKANLHLDWRSCDEVARHCRVREEGSLRSEFVDEFYNGRRLQAFWNETFWTHHVRILT